MGKVTIYLDQKTEEKTNTIVKSSGVSKRKWLADLIRERAVTVRPEHIKALAGAWEDFPSVEGIRRTLGQDAERTRF
jgi:hypothetical protein